MKRSQFLKSLLAIPFAGSVLKNLEPAVPVKKPPLTRIDPAIIRMWHHLPCSEEFARVRRGDLIISDLGDRAYVTHASQSSTTKWITAYAISGKQWKHNDMFNFKVLSSALRES